MGIFRYLHIGPSASDGRPSVEPIPVIMVAPRSIGYPKCSLSVCMRPPSLSLASRTVTSIPACWSQQQWNYPAAWIGVKAWIISLDISWFQFKYVNLDLESALSTTFKHAAAARPAAPAPMMMTFLQSMLDLNGSNWKLGYKLLCQPVGKVQNWVWPQDQDIHQNQLQLLMTTENGFSNMNTAYHSTHWAHDFS